MRFFAKFDDPLDPAMAPVLEAGGGESEGFEQAEELLIEHASHGDDHGTGIISQHADSADQELLPGETVPGEDVYGEGDSETKPDLAE